MEKWVRRGRVGLLAAGLLFSFAPQGLGQEFPVGLTNLTGELVTGYASTHTVNGREIKSSIAPLGVDLDMGGFLGHPDFLSYRAQPRLTAGAQSPQAGFRGGNGITLTSTFLRRRPFPLTIRYSKVKQDVIAFGALQGLSGVRSLTSYNDFGVNWNLSFPHLPRFSVSYSRSGSRSEPDLIALPLRDTGSTRYGMRLADSRWGWDFNGELTRDRHSSVTADVLDPGFARFSTRQDSTWGNLQARRTFRDRNTLSLTAGERDSENLINANRFNQDGRYYRASSSLAWGSRWTASLLADYNSNHNDLFRQTVLPLPADENSLPFGSGLSTATVSGLLNYKLNEDWNFFGGVDRNHTRTRNEGDFSIGGSSLSTQTGAGYNHTYPWGKLSGSYSLSVSRSSTLGDSPRSRGLGHTFSAHFGRGNVEKLELSGIFTANLHDIEQDIFLQTESVFAEVQLGRRIGAYVVRGSVGLQSIRNESLFDFSSDGWTARAGIEHRRFRLNYTRNRTDGTSFFLQPDLDSSSVLPGVPLRSILSLSTRDGIAVGLTPWKKLLASFQWNRLQQNLAGRIQNDSNFVDLAVRYNFRLLDFEVAYARYDQTLREITGLSRGAFFIRIRRPFRIL